MSECNGSQPQAKRTEDKAYSLLGLFEVFMPLIYGEGTNAFHRLIVEINMNTGERSSTDDRLMEKSVYVGDARFMTCMRTNDIVRV